MPGTFQLENGNTRIRFTPDVPFSVGELITISVSKDVTSSDGDPLTFGYAWQYWTASGPGSLDLVEIDRFSTRQEGEGWIQTYGAYAGDLNGDGWHDFSVPNERSDDVRVFLNDGTGNYDQDFDIYPVPPNSRPSTNQGADFDGDGLMDFVVGNSYSNTISVFIGDGLGAFFPSVTYPADESVRGLGVLDLDGDGDPDIVTTNRNGSNITILPNSGGGTFGTRIPIEVGGVKENACAIADINEDGILDAFVGTYESEEILVLLGDGHGGLIPTSSVSCEGAAWMVFAGDVNGDGHVDVVSANAYTDEAAVLFGDGEGNLSAPVLHPVIGFPLDINLGDLDGDGDLDLVTSSLGVPHDHFGFNSVEEDTGAWTIYENDGFGNFSNPRFLYSQDAASCCTLHDRDRDGDLDLTGIDESDDYIYVFENLGTDLDQMTVDHISGWNLLGLPLQVSNSNYQAIFPDAITGTLYSFTDEGGYVNESNLDFGNGYWLRFSDEGSNTIAGSPFTEVTVSVAEGWNLISGISTTVSVFDIGDPDNLIIPGTLFGWIGIYELSEVIEPGNGYWIRAIGNGEITIPGSDGRRREAVDTTSPLENASFLEFTNGEGHSQKLFFGGLIPEGVELSYGLPPLPPGGLDIRFEGDRRWQEDGGEISVMNDSYPLIIRYEIRDTSGETGWMITNEATGEDHILYGDGTLEITSPLEGLALSRAAVPTRFALYQNYPNPFNPVTTIRYGLPEAADVRLVIYDILGREVTSLISGFYPSGFYDVVWDASSVSSGIYIYQVSTDYGQLTKKLVLLK